MPTNINHPRDGIITIQGCVQVTKNFHSDRINVNGLNPSLETNNAALLCLLNRQSINSSEGAKYLPLHSELSTSDPSVNNLFVNGSEVVTSANVLSIGNNFVNSSNNTTILNDNPDPSSLISITSTNGGVNISADQDLNITSVDNDVNITSSDDLSLDSGNDIQFKIESSVHLILLYLINQILQCYELYEDSPNDVTNASLFNLRHNDYSSYNKTGELKLFVQDQGSTTFKTEDDTGTDANANLNFEVEGNTVFFDKDGNAESNKIMTIDGKTSLEHGLHLHKNLFLSFEVHSVDNNWDSSYTVPYINDKTVHLFNFTQNASNNLYGKISIGYRSNFTFNV